jgi:hypothetical protein
MSINEFVRYVCVNMGMGCAGRGESKGRTKNENDITGNGGRTRMSGYLYNLNK